MDSHSVGAQHAVPLHVSPPRDHALDALRTLAVLGMMAAHTARLMPPDVRPGWAIGVLLIEPVIPSLFLLLVGLSLARSFESALNRGLSLGAWYVRQLKRAGALWLVSAVFFSLELGPRLPDALLAGGILANIAYAITIIGGLLALGRDPARVSGRAPVALALILGAAAFVYLDARELRLHPLNIGNSPFLPLWLFALAGAVWGTTFGSAGTHVESRTRRARHLVALALGIAGGLVAFALISRYGLDTLFTKPFGRSDAGRLVPAPLQGGEALQIAYYNLRPVLALACLGLHLVALVALGWLAASIRLREQAASFVFALGRHALAAYILHLALLAALVVGAGARQPLKTGTQGTLILAGLIIICQAWCLFRQRRIFV